MSEESDSSFMLDEELLALSSIYGDDFAYVDESGKCISVRLRPAKEEFLIIRIPSGYPTGNLPLDMEFTAPFLRGDARKFLLQQVQSLAEERRGQGILFDVAEYAREYVTNHLDSCDSSTTAQTQEIQQEQGNMNTLSEEDADVEILHGTPFTDRRSTFQAHLAVVNNVRQVKLVLEKLKLNRKIAEATHNIVAYRISAAGNAMISDCDDDGETHAGSRLLHLLDLLNVTNVVVIVSRWFGGILLGPERFKHITNAARDILKEHKIILL